MRRVNRPVAGAAGVTKIVSVAQGGFGSTNADEAAAMIAAASSSMLGAPNGLADLDSGGKVKIEQLPDVVSKYPTLKGPTEVNPGSVTEYEITNYSSTLTYTLAASAGSVLRRQNKLIVTAPETSGTFTLTINGRQVIITVANWKPARPTLYVSKNPNAKSILFTLSDFVSATPGSKHVATEIQISDTPDFALPRSIDVLTGDLNCYTLTDSDRAKVCYARARQLDNFDVLSDWSNVETYYLNAASAEQLFQIVNPTTTNRGLDFVDDNTVIATGESFVSLLTREGSLWNSKTWPNPTPSGGAFQRACVSRKLKLVVIAYWVSNTLWQLRVFNPIDGTYIDTPIAVTIPVQYGSVWIQMDVSKDSNVIVLDQYGAAQSTLIYEINSANRAVELQKIVHNDPLTDWQGCAPVVSEDGKVIVRASAWGGTKKIEYFRRKTGAATFILVSTAGADYYNATIGSAVNYDGSLHFHSECVQSTMSDGLTLNYKIVVRQVAFDDVNNFAYVYVTKVWEETLYSGSLVLGFDSVNDLLFSSAKETANGSYQQRVHDVKQDLKIVRRFTTILGDDWMRWPIFLKNKTEVLVGYLNEKGIKVYK